MREILFRGFDVEQKKWVYGNLLVHYDPFNKNKFEARIESQTEISLKEPFFNEVDPESIGQYIGVKFYNKKKECFEKIFEGDILEIIDEWGQKTRHSVHCFEKLNYPAFDLKPAYEIEENSNSISALSFFKSDYDIKIIGNVYKNKRGKRK